MALASANFKFSSEDPATVSTSLTTVLEVFVSEGRTMGIQVVNGATALNAFQVQMSFTPSGAYQTILSAAGDYTTPAEPLLKASGNLTTLGISTTGWLMLNVRHAAKIRIQASVAAGSSDVTPSYILKG